MSEVSAKKSCPSCKSGNIKELPKINIQLPTPSNEVIFGPGPSPSYSTNLHLPFDYCADCGTVIYRDHRN